MASEVSSMPNGNHGTHNSYDMSSYNGNHQQSHHQQYQQSQQQSYANNTSTNASTKSNESSAPVNKDEVGWYFVEQYYKHLSGGPDKLYMFYTKRSQLVLGQEADKVDVCIGQKAIHDRIQSHNFEGCKIRVTNVDSQASDANILIQVIGEISLKSKPHQKFTQTFVLAAQTNGYYVLNDIFRYLVDEEDDEPTTEAPQKSQPAPVTAQSTSKTSAGLTSSSDKSEIEQSANKVAKQIESKITKAPEAAPAAASTPAPTVNGTHKTDKTEEAPAAQKASSPENTQSDASLQPEKPADPAPTPAKSPAAQPAKPAAPAPEAVSKPRGPTSWASLAASAHQKSAPAPAAAAATSPSAPAQQTAKTSPAPAPSTTNASPAPTAAPVSNGAPASAPQAAPRASSPSNDNAQQGGWTDVVADHHKRQQQKPAGQPAGEGALGRAYIKNVGTDVVEAELEQVLSQFGGSVKVEIAKQKNGVANCAFVDFKDFQSYKAAVDANPHVVGNSKLIIEERKPRPFPARGGMGPRGRGGAGGPPRGDFGQRGRGGYQASRGSARGGAVRGGRGGAPQAA